MKKIRASCTLTVYEDDANIHVNQGLEIELTNSEHLRIEELFRALFTSASAVCMEKLFSDTDVLERYR